MNKVSVGRSIARAYGFLFGRIFTIAGLSWIGALFYAALTAAVLQKTGTVTWEAMRTSAMAGHPQALIVHVAIALAALLIVAGIAVPLSRDALGEDDGFTAAHFVIGNRELRYFLALLRLYVLLIVLAVACGFAVKYMPAAVALATAQLPALAQWPVLQIAQDAAVALVAVLALLVLLRIGVLLVPVAATEDRASLLKAWSLSGGNTFRILAVMLAVLIPVYVVLFAGEYALLGQPLLDAYRSLFATWPGDPGAILRLYTEHSDIFAAATGIQLVLVLSLLAGASAAVYRTLTGADDGDMDMAGHGMHEQDGHGMHGQDMHGHDDHGHDAHGHDDHGHDNHGHDGHGMHGHDDHGHDAHGHDDHGHDDHGHDAHGHDDHGHDDHGHGAHGHDDHGHGAHGHDDHGHDHGGHGHAHHSAYPHDEARVLEHA